MHDQLDRGGAAHFIVVEPDVIGLAGLERDRRAVYAAVRRTPGVDD
jgi:hypothetical protein